MKKSSTGKTALVTGAAGFIGSHLVEELQKCGYNVKCLTRYNSGGNIGWLSSLDKDNLAELDIAAGDIRDPFFVKSTMTGCDVVFNLAALIAIPYSYHAPQSYVDTNIGGCLNVVQAARDLGSIHVVQMSTSEVYGSAQYVPIDENHPLHAQSPYAATKIGADQLAMSFHYSFGTPVTIARPFNTFGPRQSTRAVIPTIIVQLLSGAKTIQLGALDTMRDFSYVKDTVRGLIKIAETKESIGKTVNLGSGYEISVEDTAKLIAELMGKDIQLESHPERIRPQDSEVVRLKADNSLAQELLNWNPDKQGLEGVKFGLKETINWFSDSANLGRQLEASYRL